MRWLRDLLGATAPATSATLVAFFAGHAAGAGWMLRRAARVERPLALYGRLELAAAVGAFAVPLLLAIGERALGQVYDAVRETPATLALLRFAIAVLATFPAAFCFGATFPAIARAATRASRELGARGGALYAVNTLGRRIRHGGGRRVAARVARRARDVRRRGRVPRSRGRRRAVDRATRASSRSNPSASCRSQMRQCRPRRAPSAGARRSRSGAARRSRHAPAASRAPARDARSRRALVRSRSRSPRASAPSRCRSCWCSRSRRCSNQSIYAFGAVLVDVLLAIAAGGARCARSSAAASMPAASSGSPWSRLRSRSRPSRPGSSASRHRLRLRRRRRAAASPTSPRCSAGDRRTRARRCSPRRPRVSRHLRHGRPRGRGRGAGAILGRLLVANTVGAIAGAIAAPYLLLPIAGLWPSFAVLSLLYGADAVFVPSASSAAPPARSPARHRLARGRLARESARGAARRAAAGRDRARDRDRRPRAIVAVVERDGERLIRSRQPLRAGRNRGAVHQERQAHLPLATRAARAARRPSGRRPASARAARSPIRSSR